MARNKHPEQTVEQILDVSTRLFIQKGFEKTSIQDILGELALSRGAIYHHFASKDDILLAIFQRNDDVSGRFMKELLASAQGATARERLAHLLNAMADHSLKTADSQFLKLQFENTTFCMNGIERNVNNDAPIIQGLIEAGNRDGSMAAEDPEMAAETILVLFNVWTNPVIFSRGRTATEKRLKHLQKTARQMGVDVFGDALIEKYLLIYERAGMFEVEEGGKAGKGDTDG